MYCTSGRESRCGAVEVFGSWQSQYLWVCDLGAFVWAVTGGARWGDFRFSCFLCPVRRDDLFRCTVALLCCLLASIVEGIECASFDFMCELMLFRCCLMSWTEVGVVPLFSQ